MKTSHSCGQIARSGQAGKAELIKGLESFVGRDV